MIATATNVVAAVTDSASGGLSIAIDSLGSAYLALTQEYNIAPALFHRIVVISSGTLDSLLHNGAIVTLLALCQLTHRETYFDIVVVGIIGSFIALCAVLFLGTMFGSF